MVESSHIVDIVISGSDGSFESWGEAERPVIARSAIKSIQALPLVTSGAADAFHVSDDELALACSSHRRESIHISIVHAWLERIKLSDADLECGDDKPFGELAAAEAIRSQCSNASVFNCCSGQHTGFLCTAMHVGDDPRGYIGRDHPVQRRVTESLATMTGTDLSKATAGIDGCGIPVYAIALHRLALAMARLVDPRGVDDRTAAACERLSAVLPSRSHLVSGSGHIVELLQDAASEPLISKSGAEGVFLAALPDRGIGIALKTRDGATRARDQAIWGILDLLGALRDPLAEHRLLNKAGNQSGTQTAVFRT